MMTVLHSLTTYMLSMGYTIIPFSCALHGTFPYPAASTAQFAMDAQAHFIKPKIQTLVIWPFPIWYQVHVLA